MMSVKSSTGERNYYVLSCGKIKVSRTNAKKNNAMPHNQGPKPNRKCLVFRNSTVDAIKQLLVLVLDRLSSDIALGSGAWESTAVDDDDVFRGGDALVDIAARVELPRSPDDFLLEPLGIHGALL